MKLTNGLQIRKIRLQMNLTQAQIAQMLCVTTRTIERWEAGSRNCPASAVKLAEILQEQSEKKH